MIRKHIDFNDYISGFKDCETPEGDFARDWEQDSGKPFIKTWRGFEEYLKTQGACQEAIASAKLLFKNWKLEREKI